MDETKKSGPEQEGDPQHTLRSAAFRRTTLKDLWSTVSEFTGTILHSEPDQEKAQVSLAPKFSRQQRRPDRPLLPLDLANVIPVPVLGALHET